MKINSRLKDYSGIQFFRPVKHNNRLKYRSNTTTRAKLKLLSVFGRGLEFRGKGIAGKVTMGTAEKLTLESMGIAFGILSQGLTEPEIHLVGYLYNPLNCNVRFYRATAMLSAVYAVVVCLSVCVCVYHTLVLYQNGQT